MSWKCTLPEHETVVVPHPRVARSWLETNGINLHWRAVFEPSNETPNVEE